MTISEPVRPDAGPPARTGDPDRPLPTMRHLNPWLVKATKGLARESYERVREEIEDHFREAVTARIEAGQNREDAARLAVEALGSARKARRQFRRTYLTTVEANLVRSFAREPQPGASWWEGWRTRRSRIVAGTLVTIIATVAVITRRAHDPTLVAGWIILAAMWCGLAGLAATPRVFRSGNQRAAVALGAVSETAIWSGYLLGMVNAADVIVGSGLAVLLVALLHSVLRVLPKLPTQAATD